MEVKVSLSWQTEKVLLQRKCIHHLFFSNLLFRLPMLTFLFVAEEKYGGYEERNGKYCFDIFHGMIDGFIC
jgi:hypothetical protein